jgi:hypothetical protein
VVGGFTEQAADASSEPWQRTRPEQRQPEVQAVAWALGGEVQVSTSPLP